MSRRAILAGLLGGVAMYLWSALAHMVLPLGAMGIKEIPNEQPVLAGLHAALGDSHGMYIYPGLGTTPDAMQQYDKLLAANPSGLLIYHPPGAKRIEPGQLATEFLTELLESLLAVLLLAQTGIKTWRGRAGFITMSGVLAAIATNISYWNWYGFPGSYTAAYMTTQVVGFVLAGAVIAASMKNRPLRTL